MLYKLIAIAGLKNSGKDTAAEMLQYLLNTPRIMHNYTAFTIFRKLFRNGKFKIVSFAHPLKRMLSTLLEIPIERFNDRGFKENYYVYFPTLTVTNKLPEFAQTISDSKFSRLLVNKDLSFIKDSWITIRQLLQVFGTECMREIFGDNIWILSTLKCSKPMIVSDLRFKTELIAVLEEGGLVLYIDRDICKPGNHASERETQEMLKSKLFSEIIYNNGSLKELFYSLKNFVKLL